MPRGPARRVRVFRPRINDEVDLTPEKFRERFRLTREAVEKLVAVIGDDIRHDTRRNMALTPRQQVLVTLRFLATGGFYTLVGDAHGPSRATIHRTVHRVMAAIAHRLLGLISFPRTRGGCRAVQRAFFEMAGLPDVIGCIDGCHIGVRVPARQENAFINRHQSTSLNVMAVAGSDGRFLYVSAHAGGRQHDSRVLSTSGLPEKLERNTLVPVEEPVILGDSAYPSKTWLLTPIDRPATLAEERYNRAHCRTRVTVEQAFGQVKMRWACLQGSGLRLRRVADSVLAVISAAELVRRLDERLRRASTVPEIFSPTNNVLRLRLRELCEHILLSDPEEAGRKAEELLWRKVHYEPYSLAKQTGQTVPLGAFDTSLLASHLMAGLGSYQQLLLSLQTQLGVSGDGRTDLALCQPAGLTQETVTVRPSDAAGTVSVWGQAALQRILTNLGDLGRYLTELRPADYPPALAARYYNQAVLLAPSAGRPHNQLGTLAGSASHGLQAAYHYLRCMTCDDSFDGGQVNLRKLLEKNHNRRLELEMEYGNTEVPARRRLIISFLDVIYGATLMEGAKQHRFVRLCQETLQWLSFCLQPPPEEGGLVSINGRPLDGSSLEPRTVLLMVVVVILALQTLKEDAAPASGLRAFLLAAFSCLVRTVSTRLTTRFPALAAAPAAAPASAAAPAPVQTTGGRDRRGKRSRRRRAREDDSEDEEEPPLLSQLTQLSQPGLSDESDDSDSDSLDSLVSDGSDSELDERAEPSGGRPGPAELTALLKDEGLLVPLRLCCDWLRANEEVLRSCTESSAELWRQLVTLVNAVSMEITADCRVDCVRTDLVRQLASAPASLAQSTPLWEDRLLRGVHLLGTRHQHMDWTDPLRQSLTTAEEAVLRVQLLVDFCSWLTSVPQLGVTLVSGRFVHTSSSSGGHSGGPADNTDAPRDEEESGERRRQLMTNMAEQWLRSEVRSLRSRTARRGGEASFSPYVVVDTAALVTYLEPLKQMVKARQFVTVVPSAVIHELDERKATCASSREASRWLEAQFRRGNRFLRPQRANEKASLELVKYPRRKQRDQWHFFQILECCNHLSRSVPAPEPSAPPSVTLLVAGDDTAPGRDFSPRGLASAAGIHFELMTTFHSKWAVSSKGRS